MNSVDKFPHRENVCFDLDKPAPSRRPAAWAVALFLLSVAACALLCHFVGSGQALRLLYR